MRKLVLFFVLLFSFYSLAIGQIAWTPLNTGSIGDLTNLSFINANTGFLLSNYNSGSSNTSQILKTTNAGNNWSSLYSSTINFLTSLQFINVNTGFAGKTGYLIKTTNGGQNWTTILTSGNYQNFYFLDSVNGYCGGTGPFKTTNGGINWVSLSVSSIYPTAYSFLNQNIGIMAGSYANKGGSYGINYFTTNGGANWLTSGLSASGTNFMTGGILNSNFLYFAGGYSIIKSTNGGLNWQRLELSTLFPRIQSIQFVNSTTGYLCGITSNNTNGFVLISTDAGNTWNSSPVLPSVPLYGIYFTSALTGYVCGNYGGIFKTTTGGVVTGFTQTSSEIPDNFSISQNFPNPFNPLTRINYILPITNYVSIKVYDALGNKVQTLVNEKQNAGSYSVDFNAASLPSGVYFYKLVTEKFSETKKMILIK